MPGTDRAARIWHPWRHIRQRYPHLGVNCCEPLPDDLRAAWTQTGLFLRPGLTQAQRRCALTHEIVHLERGPVPRNPVLAAAEERIVSDIAARRLIPLRSLLEAFMWTRPTNFHDLADELWVDVPTLRIRLSGLDRHEVAELNRAIDQRWPWHID
ncbi:hypothetical protein [Nocardia farcinica]|uniref:hypothetical protein n=1 Tax=Nocardia farcinica TaxID=37329 RepID=UPI001892EE12|nr:hypothetical protein [Nocardia farcinica]MBF6411247.1 hypothetical protein [Nocardia farcinica]